MKMKMIQALNLSKLNHDEVLAFSDKICGLMDKVSSETAKKSSIALHDAVSNFGKILEQSPDLISLEIQAADTSVDQAWRGMNAELENHLDHPNADIRSASATVYEIWKRYDDPTELPYEDEYKTLKTLIAIVGKIPADVMKTAGVDEWFDALKERNDEFMSMWGEKTVTDSQRLANQVKKSRADLEASYADFVSFMDGWSKYAEIDEKFNDIDDEVAGVVKEINGVVAEYNGILDDRRKSVSKCIDSILKDLI